jgi:RNA polymerase sigma-70 factor (ECF subfamily)
MTDPAQGPEHLRSLVRAGSRDDLGLLLDGYREYLLLIAQRELDQDLKAKGGASDLVQETFLEAQRDFAQFHGQTEGELLAWLRQLLLNNVANFGRRFHEAAKRDVGRELPLEGDRSSFNQAAGVADSAPSPSDVAVQHEQAEAIERALARLPDDYRQVLLLRYREELPFEVVARRLGRSVNAARKLWARALERFQEEMGTPP